MGCIVAIYWVIVAVVALALSSIDGAGPALAIVLLVVAAILHWAVKQGAKRNGPQTSAAKAPLASLPRTATGPSRSNPRPPAEHHADPPAGAQVRPWTPYTQRHEVVGEYYRPEAFRRIFANADLSSDQGAEQYLIASLAPDPRNPYDPSAVAIWAGGQHVGYLDRATARRWHPTLAEMANAGQHLAVTSRVWASTGRGELAARVTLDLPPLDGIYPINPLPESAHVVLPPGGPVQVTQEDRHMDVLAPHATGGERPVALTLHAIEEVRPRSTVEVVEVRLDGLPVGILSPTQTANLLPLVKHIEAQGHTVVARAALKGNALKAELTLFTIKAQDANPTWLNTLQ